MSLEVFIGCQAPIWFYLMCMLRVLITLNNSCSFWCQSSSKTASLRGGMLRYNAGSHFPEQNVFSQTKIEGFIKSVNDVCHAGTVSHC